MFFRAFRIWFSSIWRIGRILNHPVETMCMFRSLCSMIRNARKVLGELFDKEGIVVRTPNKDWLILTRVSGLGDVSTLTKNRSISGEIVQQHFDTVNSRLFALNQVSENLARLESAVFFVTFMVCACWTGMEILRPEPIDLAKLLWPTLSGLLFTFFVSVIFSVVLWLAAQKLRGVVEDSE